MNFRLLFLTYMAAYLIQPEDVKNFNSVVIELTLVSTIVTVFTSIIYMLKAKNKKKED